MADEKPSLPVIDFASVVVAPALVMLMLGSLVFFLIEVCYAVFGGQFEARLLYTFFFYVFGIVLVARLGIQYGSGKKWIYGLLLSAAAFVAMLAFVEYPAGILKAVGPVLNVGIMALVWWSANKLTWDCTHLDESRKASGRGVLAAAGLDGTPATTQAEDDEEFDPDRSVAETRKKKKKKNAPPLTLWEKFQKFREWQKKKPHTPGVWVLYFSLAAIPLFALGQALIPADDLVKRGNTFWQMATYVGSGLGLLVTTTLMGLKRYLEDRNARIPTPMVVAWLGMGAVLILLFLGIGAALPRPHSETPLVQLEKGGKQSRKASKNAVVKDKSAGEGEGASGKRKEAGDGKSNAQGGKPGGKGEGQQSQGSGDKKGENSGGKQNGEKGNDGNKQGNEGKGNDPKNGKQDPKNANSKDPKNSGKPNEQQNQGGNEKDNEGKTEEGESSDGNDGEAFSDKLQDFSQGFEGVSEVIKWIVWSAIAVAVVVGVIYFFVKWASNFSGFFKGLLDWFRGLFGKKPVTSAKAAAAAEAVAEKAILRPPPFHSFSNPFTDGTARDRDPAELVAYSFAALDAWAWDQALGRQPDETPTEFATRIGEEVPDLDEHAAAVANLYARALFSNNELPKDTRTRLKAFWDVLESIAEPAGVR